MINAESIKLQTDVRTDTWFPALRCRSRIRSRICFRSRFRNRFRKKRVRTYRSVAGACARQYIARQAQEASRRVFRAKEWSERLATYGTAGTEKHNSILYERINCTGELTCHLDHVIASAHARRSRTRTMSSTNMYLGALVNVIAIFLLNALFKF